MKYDIPTMTAEAVSLLKSLISIPSISREETQAADFLQNYIEAEGMQTGRKETMFGASVLCSTLKADNPAQFSYRHGKTRKWLAQRPFHTPRGKR